MARRSPEDEHAVIDHAVRTVIPRFGFDADAIDGVERIPQGIKNINYRVRAGGVDWVLKRYDSPKAVPRLAFAHGLQLQLAERGFPVAELRPTVAGDTLVSDETGCYSLHAWVSGKQISIDQRDRTLAQHPDLLGDLGAALGRFHRLTATMTLPDSVRTIGTDRVLAAPRVSATSIRRGKPPWVFPEQRLRLRRRKSEFDRWILAHLPNLYQHADRLAALPITGPLAGTDVVVSHYDVNWENLVFDDGFRLLAFLDFDNAVRLHRDLDVGLAAAVLVGPDETRLTSFINAYTEAAHHDVDRSVVEIGIQVKCARSILWSVDSYLSGRVSNDEMLATWCSHLYECLGDSPQTGLRSLTWFGALTPFLESADVIATAGVL